MSYLISKFNISIIKNIFVTALVVGVLGFGIMQVVSTVEAEEQSNAGEVVENVEKNNVPSNADSDNGPEGVDAGDASNANSVSDEGDDSVTVIETGDAGAGADIDNIVNTNDIGFEDSENENSQSGDENTQNEDESAVEPVEPTEDGAGGQQPDAGAEVTDEGGGDESIDAGSESLQQEEGDADITTVTEINNSVGTSTDSGSMDGDSEENSGDELPQGDDPDGISAQDSGEDGVTGDNDADQEISSGDEDTTGELNEDKEEDEENTVEINNNNDGAVENDIEVSADTGENEASNNVEDVIIDTGDAYSEANVTNIVNSNFIGSDVFFEIVNIFGGLFGDVNINFASSSQCSFFGCDISRINIANNNFGIASTTVEAGASTGSNTASDNGGVATITTGDAYAVSNTINVLNTNIIGSNYLSFILNAFGSWNGNLVLPPASVFEEIPKQPCDGCSPGSVTVENNSEADIENNVSVSADTGSNEAGGDGGVVATGDAYAQANIMTVANTNIFGNNSLLIFIRTSGEWKGTVFGLPEGVAIIPTPGGFILDGMGLFGDASASGLPGGDSGSALDVSDNNIAVINNDISVSASTGSNTASGNGGDTLITTGDAYAAANIMNVANTNVIGRNWLFAMINIFGDWEGNIAFGQPDLWIGGMAKISKKLGDIIKPGSIVQYTLTYINNGNAPAAGVNIVNNIPDFSSISSISAGGVAENNSVRWNLGVLEPGESGSVSFTVELNSNQVPGGTTELVSTAEISGVEEDGNQTDNKDEINLSVFKNPPTMWSSGAPPTPKLRIEKSRVNGEGVVMPGDKIDYTVTLFNTGTGEASNVIAYDVMKDESGKIISKQRWELGRVFSGEEIVIDYTIELAQNAPAGLYTNGASAEGAGFFGNMIYSNVATTMLEVGSLAVDTENEEESADGNDSNDIVVKLNLDDSPTVNEEDPEVLADNNIGSADIVLSAAAEAEEPNEPDLGFALGDIDEIPTLVVESGTSTLRRNLAMIAALPFVRFDILSAFILALLALVVSLLLLRKNAEE